MLRLIIILTIGFQTTGLGQSFSGQVYMLTQYFQDEKCEVLAACDCCSTDLFFLTDMEFGMINRCLYNDSYYKGTYTIKANEIVLTFKQKVVNERINEETNKIKNELKTIEIKPYKFTISKCDNRVRLQHATIRDFKNGSRYSVTRENELMKELKGTEAWKLISQ